MGFIASVRVSVCVSPSVSVCVHRHRYAALFFNKTLVRPLLFFFHFYFIVDRQCAALINNEPDFIHTY